MAYMHLTIFLILVIPKASGFPNNLDISAKLKIPFGENRCNKWASSLLSLVSSKQIMRLLVMQSGPSLLALNPWELTFITLLCTVIVISLRFIFSSFFIHFFCFLTFTNQIIIIFYFIFKYLLLSNFYSAKFLLKWLLISGGKLNI